MVSSIGNSDSGAVQLAMAVMYQKMNAANTDGISGLSKNELSSIDAGSDVGGSAFLKSLTSQFEQLDADSNGQLSEKEIASAKPTGNMGPPPGLEIESTDGTDSTSSTNSTSSLDELIKKLLKQLEEAFSKQAESTSDSKTTSASDKTSPLFGLSSADTDGTVGLSLDELSSIDETSDSGKANFINNLKTNFDKIDADGNGQLSQSEIAASKPKGSPSEFAANSGNGGSSSFGNSLGSFSGAFINKLISSYKDGGLSNLTSSLNLAG